MRGVKGCSPRLNTLHSMASLSWFNPFKQEFSSSMEVEIVQFPGEDI